MMGVTGRLQKYTLMVAAGLLSFMRRVAPELAPLHAANLQPVAAHMNSESFKGTRHGSADYRLDRTSLWLSGPVNALYGDSVADFLFMVMFVRMCCNHNEAGQSFLARWRQQTGDVLRPSNWNAKLVLPLLLDVWNPTQHWTGYGPRMLPQNHRGQKGQWQQQGVEVMNDVARRIQLPSLFRHRPWLRAKPDNEATVKYISSLMNLDSYNDGFWLYIVARDLQAKAPSSFDAASCYKCGENGENGLDIIFPKVMATDSELRKLNRVESRLQLAQLVGTKLVTNALGVDALRFVPDIDSGQFHEHNMCEYMQQHERKDKTSSKNQARERRSDSELQEFFLASLPGLFGEAEREHVRVALSAGEASQSAPLSDADLLAALKQAWPDQVTDDGMWRRSFADRLCKRPRYA